MGITKDKAHQKLDPATLLGRPSFGLDDLPECLFWPGTSPEATRVYCYLLRCAIEGFWPSPMQIVGQCLRSAYGRKDASNGALIHLLDEVLQELDRLGVAYWSDDEAVWDGR